MTESRPIKLFRDGAVQAVHIPADLELPGDEAIIRREGDRLILEPRRPSGLLEFLRTLRPLDEDFPDVEDLPPQDKALF